MPKTFIKSLEKKHSTPRILESLPPLYKLYQLIGRRTININQKERSMR